MTVKERITNTLMTALAPSHLAVIDESDQHRGHGGWREGGETHFRVELVSEQFRGKSRVERHRMVNMLLADELAGRVHALALSLRAPDDTAPDR
ncbi:MAG: BolA family transcriptional regulator [Hyphomicrobiales bacterium]|nr:BolA family transcriptional regulator [Hyphomicrobiales bacterium]